MTRYLRLLIPLVLFAFSASSLPAQDKFVLFGGYSYLRSPVTVQGEQLCPQCATSAVILFPITNRQNLNGWELAATYRFLPFLGIAADFSGHYGSAISGLSSNAHQFTFLLGPEVSLPTRVSPFAHVLFGGTHQSVSGASPSPIPLNEPSYLIVLPTSNNAFATALGAGIDSSTQNQPRISAGLVFRL